MWWSTLVPGCEAEAGRLLQASGQLKLLSEFKVSIDPISEREIVGVHTCCV